MNFIYVKCHIQVMHINNLIKLIRTLINYNLNFHVIMTMHGNNQPKSNKIDCSTINTTQTYVWKQ
jgi:hypothetical protein